MNALTLPMDPKFLDARSLNDYKNRLSRLSTRALRLHAEARGVDVNAYRDRQGKIERLPLCATMWEFYMIAHRA